MVEDDELEDEDDVAKEMFAMDIPRVDAVKGPATGLKFVVLKAGQAQDPAAIARLTRKKETPMAATSEAPVAPPETEELKIVAKRRRKVVEELPLEPVAKADGDEDLDASTVLGDPDTSGGDPDIPGSEGWEAVDAATAQKWTAILSRAKQAMQFMAERELQEAATGDDDDASNAWDLEDANSCLDYAIGTLAAFAAGEQAESDLAAAGGVVKALEGFPTEALETLEGLGPVKKSGRVLSASNEQAIRAAVESLQNVLSSLPAAPVAEESAQKAQEMLSVNKSQAEAAQKALEHPETPAPAKTTEPVDDPVVAAYDATHAPIGVTAQSRWLTLDAMRVRKAKGDAMVACYNSNGDLIGVVDPDDLITTAAGKPAETTDGTADDGSDADAAATPAAAPALPAPATTAAAPAAAPATKSQDIPDPAETKSLAESLATAVAKALEPVLEDHSKVVKELEERIGHMEQQPRPGGPLLNGVATGGLMPAGNGYMASRGQDISENQQVEAVRKQLAAEADPLKQIELSKKLFMESYKAMRGVS